MSRDKACWWVLLEVGMPIMSFNFPCRSRSAIRSTACLAVEPVPRPTTMPDSTNSTAL
uniref:Uncharacterized protein n=1 Tax=Rhizophora mucronata TaxID=61149 RepID=A0A2P2QZY0_RHIMU